MTTITFKYKNDAGNYCFSFAGDYSNSGMQFKGEGETDQERYDSAYAKAQAYAAAQEARLASPEYALEQAKAAKQAEINNYLLTDWTDTGYTGYVFPVTLKDRQELNDLLTMGTVVVSKTAATSGDPIHEIYPQNVSSANISLDDLEMLIIRYGQEVVLRKKLQNDLDAASDITAVNAITVPS